MPSSPCSLGSTCIGRHMPANDMSGFMQAVLASSHRHYNTTDTGADTLTGTMPGKSARLNSITGCIDSGRPSSEQLAAAMQARAYS